MSFSLFGFPVQVHWTFFLVALFLAGNLSSPTLVLIGGGIIFVSVLVHEFGHAGMARAFGMQPRILLHTFGGMTFWGAPQSMKPQQRLAITLAGPFAGFLVAGLLLALGEPEPDQRVLRVARATALWVNIGWGVLNLLPVLPLDGGHALSEILTLSTGRPQRALVHRISFFTALVLALMAITNGMLFAGIMAGLLAWSNFAALRQLNDPFMRGGWR
jgi:membrane-associated protease RseP (regulator of RpoE activity)